MFGFFQRKEEDEKFKKPYYSFRSCKAGRVLDVAQDGENQGSLIIWDGYGGENQMFTLKKKGDGYRLKCKKDKLYLTVESAEDGARIYAAGKNGQANQTFKIEEREPDSKEYIIYTFCGKALDVFQCNDSNGTPIVQWEYNGGQNQHWNLCDPQNITSSSSEIE